MKSKDSLHLIKEQVSIEAADRAFDLLTIKLDTLIAERITINRKHLTVKGACEYLSVGRSTFYNLVNKHKPMKIILGGSPRFAIVDLDRMFSLE